ncbi:metal ABC transporter substrate-binding protein [Polynucleobacter arcticus]|nr:metal ABC transporter substrate-binding protein [Polynucleobacter arcticus]
MSSAAFAVIKVVTTTTDLKSFVEYVGGDKVQAISMVLPGAEAEDYAPKPQDLDRLKTANLVVRVGLDYDLWLDRILRQTGRPELVKGGAAYVDASNAIVLLEVKGGGIGGGGHAHGAGNPHYWLDPNNAAVITGNIVEALARIDVPNAKYYEKQRIDFLASLDRKTLEWQEKLEPLRGKPLLTYHNNWPYLARRFRLNFAGTVESRPGVSPSAAELSRLLTKMGSEKIHVIVKRPQEPNREVNFLVKKLGAQIAVLSTSVGDDGAKSYIQMMDNNIKNLLAAFNKNSK